VIIISDLQGAVGGELQLIKQEKKAAFELLAKTNNNVPADQLLNACILYYLWKHLLRAVQVNYLEKGYGIFMQGSEIVHHVTSVTKANEPRISLVNSYQPQNAYRHDMSVYQTFNLVW
jgi:hypothetical protein